MEAQLPWVEASPGAIRQILDVLLDNALPHGDGEVTLAGSRVGQGAVVSVADHGHTTVDGEGIFIRRSLTASGSGIGLALARRASQKPRTCVSSSPIPVRGSPSTWSSAAETQFNANAAERHRQARPRKRHPGLDADEGRARR